MLFAAIPKKQNKWRFIALLSFFTKLFNLLLLRRLSTAIDPLLSPSQAGFRKGRNTLQHITTLQCLLGLAHSSPDFPLALGFVDFANAFPSVSWDAIQGALDAFHVPPFLASKIMSIIRNSTGQVGRANTQFNIGKGVMQGDTLAPFLFILVLDRVLNDSVGHLSHLGVPISRGTTLTHLAFADDVVFASHSTTNLSTMLSSLATRASSIGLLLNFSPNKTEALLTNCEGPVVVSTPTSTTELRKTTKYTYLGLPLCPKAAVDQRCAMALTANTRLLPLYASPSLSHRTKLLIFQTLAEPVLLYGLACLPLTPPLLKRLQGTYTTLLRMVVTGCSGSAAHITRTIIYDNNKIPEITTKIWELRYRFLQRWLLP
ncbi:MAG TPA: reverse transcriptase family protein, partial [bacterium]|nr:reverse transcriptase family protein [bacterium]